MEYDEIKFEYSLESYGWAEAVFELNGQIFIYQPSYLCHPLRGIFEIAVEALPDPAKEGFNDYSFIIDDESRKIEINFIIHVGQNKIASMKIFEKSYNKDVEDIIFYTGVINFHEFVSQALKSATNILKEYGLTGYYYSWQDPFPLTDYLRTLDYFEDYHNLDMMTIWENETKGNLLKTNIHDEINLLLKHIGKDQNIRDIFYYMYKGNLLQLQSYLESNPDEINKMTTSNNPCTPLICAIKGGMESCALMLIRYGSDINLTDKYEETPLHFAVRAHSFYICQKLIEMNKKLINLPNRFGRTPIFSNIPEIKNQTPDGNDYKIFDLFLQNDVDLYQVSDNKSTPFDMILANEKHYKNGLIEYIKKKYPKLLNGG